MKTFGEILSSLKSNFEPQNRTLKDIGVILSKAYTVYKHPKFEKFSPFTPGNPTLDINRTTVERLIWEIQRIQTKDGGSYVLASEGIERVIADIQTLNVYSINPGTDSHIGSIINSAKMEANLRYMVDVARQGLLFTHQKIIQDQLNELEGKNSKLNYLHNTIISLKQNEKLWDNNLFNSLNEYLKLEISKWEQFQEEVEKKAFQTQEQLYEFVITIIQDRLAHNIQYLEGYRVFWRDENCQTDPKKENEIHHYLKSILKPYCDEQGIKIVRENVIANGKIDMTFTYLNFTICLEVKKAHHSDILTGVNKQLSEYMIGEETQFGIYLILWYKSPNGFDRPSKYFSLDELISKIEVDRDDFQYRVLGIDCSKPTSPSKKR